jgi:CreA protein
MATGGFSGQAVRPQRGANPESRPEKWRQSYAADGPSGWLKPLNSEHGEVKELIALMLLLTGSVARAEPIGEVDTVFKLIGPDHKIVVDAHEDPKVAGVTCYVSRAKTGGITGALGVAEDRSEASIDCKQVGPITFTGSLPVQEEIFTERISLVFKKIHVVRMVDKKRNVLVYLTYSDRLIEGSPQNSVTAITVDRSTPIPMK